MQLFHFIPYRRPFVITKAIALSLKYGQILHHKSLKNADKTPMRVRVTGAVKTWKTRPDQFSIPVKYGTRTCGYIDNYNRKNAEEWEVA